MGWFLMFLIWAAVTVLSDLFRPKVENENAKPTGLGDFRVPTATEGRPEPIGWGTFQCSGPNVVWTGDLIQEAITRSQRTGLFSSDDIVLGHRYFLGMQLALCHGGGTEVSQMRRLWIGDDLAYNATGAAIASGSVSFVGTGTVPAGTIVESGLGLTYEVTTTTVVVAGSPPAPAEATAAGDEYNIAEDTSLGIQGTAPLGILLGTRAGPGGFTGGASDPVTPDSTFIVNKPELFGGEDLGQGGVVGTMRFFGGSYSQAVSAYLSGFQQEATTGDTPAYRGACYVAPDSAPTLLGTSTSIAAWKFELRRIPNGLALSAGEATIDGGANPANVLYEILTNDDWGYGESAGDIGSTFATVAATLATEGNGFSFLLDRQMDLPDLVRLVEQQIDGYLFKDPVTQTWEIKLARDDYDIDLVLQLDEDNLVDAEDWNQGTWEGLSSEVHVPYVDPEDEYKETFAPAQNMALVQILGTNVTSTVNHPGVKNADLANAIAWRELRTLSRPLASGRLVVDRTAYAVVPGDVVALTHSDLNVTKLPIRVTSVDRGDLLDGRIVIEGTQDVFKSGAGVFGAPPNTLWVPPTANLVAYPTDEQLAFEAPRMITSRDLGSAAETDKVYAAARRAGGEVTFQIRQRNHATTPAGSFTTVGEVVQFMLVGELKSALALSGTNPVASVLLTTTPDSQAVLEAAFPTVTDLADLGTELLSLCLIGDPDDGEFVLVESAQDNASDVELVNVHRGIGDTVQADRSAGDPVYLVFVGGGISSATIPAGNVVDVKLIPRAASGTLAEPAATTVQFTMDDRTRRPYPPASFDLNGTTLDTTSVDLDGSGSGEDVGILVDEIVRRDFRTVDEIEALGADAATLFADFPTAYTTEVEVEVRDGVTVLDSEAGISGTSATMRQLDILAGLDTTTLPASLSIAVRQSHTLAGTVYKSRAYLVCTFTVDSPFVGKHAFGELDENEASTAFVVVADTVDHVFNLSSSFTVGDVEYRINGGSWTTLISAGGTGPGTIPNASLSASDTIEVRHTSTDTAPQKLLTMTVSGTEEAYGVLIS